MKLVENIFKLAAPHSCIGCGREGFVVCPDCLGRESKPLPSRCAGCLRLTEDSKTCAACRPRLTVRHVWVGQSYGGLVKQALWEYKFGRKRQAAVELAAVISGSVPKLTTDTLVTFIPTATTRVRQRGYDQAELLAKMFAAERRLTCRRLLGRANQARQVGSGRRQRFDQLEGAFWVLDASAVKNKPVIILDDIITTGATIAHAARVLRSAGAASVSAAVVASGL